MGKVAGRVLLIAIVLVVGLLLVFVAIEKARGAAANRIVGGQAEVEVCFTPEMPCEGRIVELVDQAQKEALVMAYTFTSKPVLDALLRAQGRGVRIEVILDASQASNRSSVLLALQMARIPLWLDQSVRIMHNKVLILDRERVVTGSYNLTKSAAESNAENLIVLTGSDQLVAAYVRNFDRRKKAAERVEAKKAVKR